MAKDSIHNCIKVEMAFVKLMRLVEMFDGLCPCQIHMLSRHVDGCWYTEMLKRAHELQRDASIDPHGVLWREMMLEIERARDKENENTIPANNS